MQKELICKWNDMKKRIQDQAQYEQTAKVSVMGKADPWKPYGPRGISLRWLVWTRFVQNLYGTQRIFEGKENN